MVIKKVELLQIVNDVILENDEFKEAVAIARINSSGKVWLIGGFLYKNIAHELYGSKKSTKDFDLVVEGAKANNRIVFPKGWEFTINNFGGIKFSDGSKEIDFIPLERIYYIQTKKLEPCIENYFAGAPFNIHCLAYDINANEILGDVGINALEEKVVRVHNLEMLKFAAKLYKTTPNKMIIKKARELDFRAELV